MSNIIQRGTLSVLNQNDVVPADITQIIDSYKNLEKLGRSVSAIATERAGRRSLHPELTDVITNREMVVLLLVAERKTNKEIVQEFGISPETVKRHAVSLYRKLDVHNRRQAVVRARNLGILPAE